MKKLLLISLLFISMLSHGQMIITPVIGEKFAGYIFNYKLYQPKVASDFWLICYHGKGELGPIDGSSINKVEAHGYPMHAKNGFEFPFNIIAVQAQTSYNYIRQFFPAYVKLKYGAGVIIVTGLSMGGYAAFDTPTYDYMNLVYAIAPICGGGNTEAMKKWPEVRGWAFHGDKDGTVNYRSSEGPVKAYNDTHTLDIRYTKYKDVGHNAWDKAYSVKPGEDELLQQMIQWFKEAPKLNDAGLRKEMVALGYHMRLHMDGMDQDLYHLYKILYPDLDSLELNRHRYKLDTAIHK